MERWFIICPSCTIQSTRRLGADPEKQIYYYHGDHLGSSHFITNLEGEIAEHIEYVPFGEVFIEEHNGSFSTPYLYNGKELDPETGYYYYGARYYDPRVSQWLSVDPLAEKYPSWSPYAYTFNNPVKHTDFDGRKPEDIVIRGNDKKEWRIKTAGEDVVYNVPFALKNNATLDVGIGNVNPSRFAVGYTVQGDIGAGFGIGGSGGLEMSVVQFTDSNYSGYNYVYAGVHEQFSAGAQATVSASVGGSVFIAYNTSKDKIDPTTYAGVTSSTGVSVDAKFIAGGGVNVNMFSGSAKAPGWKGVSFGVSAGVGAGANVGSGNVTLSKTWLLNDVKPTAQRSLIDRAVNRVSPVTSAIVTGMLDNIRQCNKK